MSLTFNDYQAGTAQTAIYPSQGGLIGILYTAIGLGGEAGEVLNKVKKILRDDNGELTEDKRNAIARELGGVCWYLSQLATECGLSLNDIAQENLNILASRKERGVIQGSGDNR